MGYVYAATVNRLGQKVATGPYQHPRLTICGLSLTPEVVAARSTVLPHDSPHGCRECLRGLSSRLAERVQPVAL
jgi:hypothetical protein